MTDLSAPRYLTKSRFKLALECPTKLFYTGKPSCYGDVKLNDEFLRALADGGFQVGELAKLMFPEGQEVTTEGHDAQVEETRSLLERENVTLFEAAICHEQLFARVDILRKRGAKIELIEVKAKSFDSTDPNAFRGPKGGLRKDMLPYLQDVAFQRHVLTLAYPQLVARSFLMLPDKSKACSVDGLNGRFRIIRRDGRPPAIVDPSTNADELGTPVLELVDVDEFVDEIVGKPLPSPGTQEVLAKIVPEWARCYEADIRIPPTIGAQCAGCEFRTSDEEAVLRSGFQECWQATTGLNKSELSRGTVLDLWNCDRRQELIDQKVYKLSDVTREQLRIKEGVDGLSISQRQWMQVSSEWPGGEAFYFDAVLMKREMASWTYPLHFIDFETARVALPFSRGQTPYCNIAFQFSHHVVEANGSVAHRTQFLEATPGTKPNYHFVRHLSGALGSGGTVFMWTKHENTTLNAVLAELDHDAECPDDVDELRKFLLSLTAVRKNGRFVRKGGRAMYDLAELAQRAFFHPATHGSSSIKKVLPAVLQSSTRLRQIYSQPIYGTSAGIASHNFLNFTWWREQGGQAQDPYSTLPPVFRDLPPEVYGQLESSDDMEIAQGGAAATAYGRLQFEDLAPGEREHIQAALLRYCELDTLAMVMIYQAWVDWAQA